MGLKPVYYLADFKSGNLLDVLPVENVSLSSRLEPGVMNASLDLRKTGRPMAEARALLEQLKYGRASLVPVLEGLSTGAGNPATSRALGEWWISKVSGTYRDPIVSLSGPEFAGYTAHLLNAEPFKGTLDPVVTARKMLSLAFTYSQDIVVNLQSWVSSNGTKVEVDVRDATENYLAAIQDLQASPGGPFEWVIRAGLVQSGGSPTRVTRTLLVGQPVLARARDDITLEVTAPGQAPASLLDASWGLDEGASATNLNGFGAGHGADQIGPVHESRRRVAGEPGKSRMITNPAAMTAAQMRRTVRAALEKFTPENQTFTAVMPVDRYTPSVGERYQWRADESWTRPAESGTCRCAGWSWRSSAPENYQLELVR